MSLEKEFSFYKANRKKLQKEYLGKFLVIMGEEVKSAHDSLQEAYLVSLKNGLKLGTFLIQEVTADSSDIEQTFYSRVHV